MTMIERLGRRHRWLEEQIAAEQASGQPDEARIGQLKKLKLAVKDRILLARRHPAPEERTRQRA
jgi:hypothetical protein